MFNYCTVSAPCMYRQNDGSCYSTACIMHQRQHPIDDTYEYGWHNEHTSYEIDNDYGIGIHA